MIYASNSSGPVLSGLMAITALFMWRYRQHTRLIPWLLVFGYIGFDFVMNAPAYYILARVGIIDGRTAWHRAYLIERAIYYLHEWWLAGTDVTRHWMPYGIAWSERHSDITNHYLAMGVVGGLPLMLLFIAILIKGFSFVGKMLRQAKDLPQESQFFIWAFGASLFTHAVTFMSVSYFDQSVVFLYLTLGAIGSMSSTAVTARCREQSTNVPFTLSADKFCNINRYEI
jgi:hypothetical protein